MNRPWVVIASAASAVIVALALLITVPLAVQAAPTPAPAEDESEEAVCHRLSDFTFTACAKGYRASGGSMAHDSGMYRYATDACTAAAVEAYGRCRNNGLVPYVKDNRDACGVVSAFMEDCIKAGCVDAVSVGPEFVGQCIEKWAPKGAQLFNEFCTKNSGRKLEPGGTTPFPPPSITKI